MFKHKRVAIDFDGTLFEDGGNIDLTVAENVQLAPKANADHVTQWLRRLGFEILIFTCRPDYHRAYMEQLLGKANIAFDYILFYTKPRVDLYIDDKGFRFEDWDRTKSFIEKKLHESDQLEVKGQNPNSVYEVELRKTRIRVFADLVSDDVDEVLDYGCGPGLSLWENTEFVVDGFDIDPDYREQSKAAGKFRKVYSETPDLTKYDALVLCGVLEHIKDDQAFLECLKEARSIFLTVPNATSFHRRLGKDLGFLSRLDELTSQDFAVGHERYYDNETLLAVFKAALGETHEVDYFGSHSFKAGSNAQMSGFADISESLDRVAETCGLTGPNNFSGAELILFARKK